MNYVQYFHAGRKLALKATVEKPDSERRFDSFFAIIASCSESILEIAFPPPHDHVSDYPFSTGQKIEVLTDRYGMGVSVNTKFAKKCDNGNVQLRFLGDMTYFNRRCRQRANVRIWLGIEIWTESIAFMRGKWQQLAEHFRGESPSPHLADFARRELSLSSNGIGLNQESAMNVGEHLMLYMALNDDQPTICILGEVIRSDVTDKETFDIGIHFDCIMEDDRIRIGRYVSQTCRTDE